MTDHDDDDLATVIQLPVRRHPDETSRDNRDADDRVELGGTETAPRFQPDACSHRGSIVDKAARTVVCSKCGVPLDPLDTLAAIANHHDRILETRRRVERDTDSKIRDLRHLEREERNAKARLRTARKRSLLLDRESVVVAARSVESIGGYQHWDKLSEPQQQVVLDKTARIIEAYAGALDAS